MEETGENRLLISEPEVDLEALVIAAKSQRPEARLSPGERRRVAILFVELQDLYSWSEVLNTNEMSRVLDKIYTVFSGIVASFGGYVDRKKGAVIRALFGHRAASEMDGQRAVRAALDMFDTLHNINRYLAKHDIHLDIKASVHIGSVAVDALGKLQGGGALSLAIGLKTAAAVNSVLVDQNTRVELGDMFLFEHLGPIYLHNLKAQVETQRVIGVNPRGKGRWNRSSLVRRSQFVGRTSVLDDINLAYKRTLDPEGWRYQSEPYASRRRWVMPTLIGLKGGAGSGKSRIIFEFRLSIDRGADTPILCPGGRADPLSHVPYGLFVDLLKDLTGITGEDSPTVRRRKLQAIIRPLAMDDPSIKAYVPVLGHLLGIRYEDAHLEDIGPQGLQAEINTALTALVRATAIQVYSSHQAPLILQFFDLHATDDRSEMALLAILERLRLPVPLVVIATYRSEYRLSKELGLCARLSEHVLGPLEQGEVSTLISSMLDGFAFPDSLVHRVSQLAGGNPYFVEEMVRNMVDEGALVKSIDGWQLKESENEVSFPESLGGLILSRVDTLPKSVRDTLVFASAIGAVFSQELLMEVCRRLGVKGIAAHLKVLESARHIRPVQVAQTASYSFPNLLSREAVYASLLPENRLVLHSLIGDSILALYAKNLPEHFASLAQHYKMAKEKTKAIQFYAMAAENAYREYSLDLVQTYCKSLITLGVEGPVELRVRHRLAMVYQATGRFMEAAETLTPIIPIYEGVAKGPVRSGLQVDVLIQLSRIFLQMGQLEKSMSFAQRALREATALQDEKRMVEARVQSINCLGLMDRFDEAGREINDLSYGSSTDSLKGRVPSMRGRLALLEGRVAEAVAYLEDALRIHLAQGDKVARCEDLCDLTEVFFRSGQLAEAKIRLGEALTLSDEVPGGLVRKIRMLQGAVRAGLGEDAGFAQLMRLLDQAGPVGDLKAQGLAHRLLAILKGRNGDQAGAEKHELEAAKLWGM